jgi:hypothetical protein
MEAVAAAFAAASAFVVSALNTTTTADGTLAAVCRLLLEVMEAVAAAANAYNASTCDLTHTHAQLTCVSTHMCFHAGCCLR